jgi:hypothetical protein
MKTNNGTNQFSFCCHNQTIHRNLAIQFLSFFRFSTKLTQHLFKLGQQNFHTAMVNSKIKDHISLHRPGVPTGYATSGWVQDGFMVSLYPSDQGLRLDTQHPAGFKSISENVSE